MARLKETSMRMRYFGSYLGIVLFACVLIGLLGLERSVQEINDISVLDYKEKMRLTVDELELQQEIMENISYSIKSSAMYRPFFVYRNAYYETDIVEDISKFKDYSPLIDEYYCVQSNIGNVYSPSGKLDIEQFATYKLNTNVEFVERLFDTTGFQVISHPTKEDTLLFALSFRILTDGKRQVPDTCLMFMVTKEALLDRLETISALDVSMLSLYWRDILLLGDEQNAQNENALRIVSENGDYCVYSGIQPGQIYPHLQNFSIYFLLFLVFGTSVLLILAAYVAYRNYKPLNKLIDRLNIPANGSAQDIETAVKTLQDMNRSSEAQLQKNLIEIAHQRREIAQQLLFTRLSGIHSAQVDTLLSEAGIALEHLLFCVCLILFKKENKQDELISSVARSLSDDDLSIYPAGVYQNQYYIILLNFDSIEQLDAICPVLLESLDVESSGVHLYVGDVCEEMRQLPQSFVSAISRRETEFEQVDKLPADYEITWYDDRQVKIMMQALREGNSLKAETCVTEVIKLLEEKYPSPLLQRCIWTDIGNQLLKVAKSMDVTLDLYQLQMLLVAADTASFGQQLSVLINQLIAACNERTAQENSKMEQDVMNYISENFCLPQFNTADVADHFNISERKIGSIVKMVTGISYKEFIVKLRMERAKVLLIEDNYNVSQTGESVGYNNIPYFIKSFRNYTGYTPGEYKKLFDKQNENPSNTEDKLE